MFQEDMRKLTLGRRASLNEAERKVKSKEIQKILLELPQWGIAQTVMIYLNFRDEVETEEIAQYTLDKRKKLIIPYCHGSEIIPCQVGDLAEDVELSSMGILEPRRNTLCPVEPQEIDIALVPGVVFDPYGNRIGYGRGFYDRFLPKLRKGVPVIGLAFECQMVERILSKTHDYKMSFIITENGLIYPK